MRPIYTFFMAVLVFLSTPAIATESPFTGGMHQKTLYVSKTPESSPEEDPAAAETKKKSRVWNRYKSLAAGQEESAPDKDNSSATPEEPAPPETQEKEVAEAPKPGGLGTLLQKYQQSKTQRKELRSLSFPEPEALKTENQNMTDEQEKTDMPAGPETQPYKHRRRQR